jgi:hypothetical protein
VDGEAETSTSLGVRLWEFHTLGDKGTGSSDGELVAGNVVLGTTGRASRVKCNGLSAEEVVTRGDVGGDLEVKLSA